MQNIDYTRILCIEINCLLDVLMYITEFIYFYLHLLDYYCYTIILLRVLDLNYVY